MQKEIIVYVTNWCGHSRQVIRFLKTNGIPLKYVDIDTNPDGRSFVTNVNHGNHGVRTVVLADGSILVEPLTSDLAQILTND